MSRRSRPCGRPALSEHDGALIAFDDLRIGLTSDGGVTSLLGPTEAVVAARIAPVPGR